jgi:hypothetical protein
MRSQGRVFKRCGCVNRADGRTWGSRCPRLRERGHGSWYVGVELPAGRDGRRRQLRRGGFRTRATAEAARAYVVAADVRGDRGLITVGQWLDLWLEMRRTLLASSTRRIYAQLIDDYLKPRLGGVLLTELSGRDRSGRFHLAHPDEPHARQALVAGDVAPPAVMGVVSTGTFGRVLRWPAVSCWPVPAKRL